ncbi:ECF transporter S component [Defluviitalea phaphyphila]|uniref:ECF transporter S component n=1 Tax=Defluviitalea phaphyphila TaxID=1473580 RepID=UPI0007DC17FA|nr:ECF transporter S component [Defluviitalea phaphyphila]
MVKTNTKKLVISSFFIALGVVLPQVFHIFGGKEAGSLLLPMHIPVLLAGFIVGYKYGFYVGILTPILSHFITGMPPISPVPILPMMIFELATYGLVSGILYQKLKQNLFVSLFGAMITGRIAYAIVMWGLINIFGISFPAGMSIITSVTSGIPGIILQIILIPSIVQGLKFYQRKSENKKLYKGGF